MTSGLRFRRHEQFPFLVFGVCQKHQVCRSVSLQIKKSAFQNHRAILERLWPEDFRQASKEEIDRKPYSNAGIRLLRKNLRAVRTRIQGMDESRLSMRSKVWSTVLLFNPPSLWITINPADTQDPIAQVIARADIDLDKFCRMSGPNSQDRAITMAQDPYAAAKFFHSIIRILLETVFGISKTKYSIHRKEGAYGTVQAYLGTVEAQGRGSLHMHMLVWLKDAPTAKVMQLALQHDQFSSASRGFYQVDNTRGYRWHGHRWSFDYAKRNLCIIFATSRSNNRP